MASCAAGCSESSRRSGVPAMVGIVAGSGVTLSISVAGCTGVAGMPLSVVARVWGAVIVLGLRVIWRGA